MVVMSLSKVNSIIPDKYQMALEPMNVAKKEREPYYRPNKSQRMYLNEVETQT